MSDQTPFDFGRLIPGFNFFQGLAGGRPPGGGPAGLDHWIAPTVDIDELERRITELKAVQFWLEQNLLGMKATIQALEVQKMTLATLRSMNLSLTDVAKAFTLPTPPRTGAEKTAEPGWPFASPTASSARAEAEPSAPPADDAVALGAGADQEKPAPQGGGQPMLDPVQWWGALSQQFQQIAAQTLKEAAPAAVPGAASEAAGAAKRKPVRKNTKAPAAARKRSVSAAKTTKTKK